MLLLRNAYLILFAIFCFLNNIAKSKMDRSSSLFDPNGRLLQVEYAYKATSNGNPVTAAKLIDCVIVISSTGIQDSASKCLMKTRRLDDFACCSFAGIASDSMYIANKLFDMVTENHFLYGSSMPTVRLANEVADIFHKRTMSEIYRPLGLKAIIAGYDEVTKSSVIEIDPLGNIYLCKLSFIGNLTFSITNSVSKYNNYF